MQDQRRLNGQQANWFEDARVLITGGGGYLGSSLAQRLSSCDCKIYLADLNFNHLPKRLTNNPNVTLYQVDLTNKTEVVELCQKIQPTVIYHFAASLNRKRDFSLYEGIYNVNVNVLLNLLNALKEIDYKGLYLSSTSELYGELNSVPFVETMPKNPVSPYSLTKSIAEELLSAFSKIHDKPYTIFRIFNFFGPEQPATTFIGEMIKKYQNNAVFVMSKGEQQRDFIYIDELINQILYMSSVDKKYNIYNLCSGKGTSLLEIVEEFQNITNTFEVEKKLPYRQNEIMKIVGSTERLVEAGYIQTELDWNDALKNCISIG